MTAPFLRVSSKIYANELGNDTNRYCAGNISVMGSKDKFYLLMCLFNVQNWTRASE